MARKYETQFGSVIVKEYAGSVGMMKVVGVLLKDGEIVEYTRCEVGCAVGTTEENRKVRRVVADVVLEKYKKENNLYTHDEVATFVARVVHKRLREAVYGN
jgi:hypothetical protein